MLIIIFSFAINNKYLRPTGKSQKKLDLTQNVLNILIFNLISVFQINKLYKPEANLNLYNAYLTIYSLKQTY